MKTAAAPEMLSHAAVQDAANVTQRDVLAFVTRHGIAVTDQASLIDAGHVREMIGERENAILAQMAQPKRAAHGVHAWICTLERALLAPLRELDERLKREIQTYYAAETIRREAREREIAKARQEAEQARAATEAAALERAGEHALAAAVVEDAISAPPPVVALVDEVRAVQAFRRTWKCDVVDLALVPREFLVVDLARLGSYARAMKESANVPGVRFYFVDEPIR
jgi:hypothetical protein